LWNAGLYWSRAKTGKAKGHKLHQGAARDKAAKLANLAGESRAGSDAARPPSTIRSFIGNLPKKSCRYELPTKSSIKAAYKK
jgi:hypothetical protein